jgi:hypothetical protein
MYYYNSNNDCVELDTASKLWNVKEIKGFTEEWRRNDAGGEEHYRYGGDPCFVSLFVYESSGDIVLKDGNGKEYSKEMLELDYIKNDLVLCSHKAVNIGSDFYWVYG